MEIYEPLLRILKRGYGRFRTRRITEVLILSASVIAPFVLGALVLGLLLGGSFARWEYLRILRFFPALERCWISAGEMREKPDSS